jgi:hypothetical protein
MSASDVFGGKFFGVPSYRGPSSYANGVGDLLDPIAFGFESTILFVSGSVSVSGTYYVMTQPASELITRWHVRWIVLASGQEVSEGIDLSGESVQLMGFGI